MDMIVLKDVSQTGNVKKYAHTIVYIFEICLSIQYHVKIIYMDQRLESCGQKESF